MLKLGILCSGGLGLDTLKKTASEYPLKFILTDRNSQEIVDFAAARNIPHFAGNPRNGIGYNFIKDTEVDVIMSINYLFLIEEDIIQHSKKLIFNIHGSLLPKYRGRTPHVWAIINGETKTGITAHVIDSGCDTGKIIDQIEIPINYLDTGATILDKYAKAYFPLVKNVLAQLESGTLVLKTQDETQATYFGKRTPLDGEINWNWDKERIRNWVRAQAYPYPGAFTFLDNEKIIIDKISIGGEDQKINHYSNGEIIKTEPYIEVKVNNGSVILEAIRTENVIFEQGKYFGNEN